MIEYLQIYSLGLRFPTRETDKVDMLALGSRCWCWVRGIGGGRELPSEFISPCLTYWHWVWVWTSWHWVQVGFKKALGSRRWVSRCRGSFWNILLVSRCWRWVIHVSIGWFWDVTTGWFQDIGAGFETLGLSSKCWRWFREVAVGVWDVDAATKTSWWRAWSLL